VGVANFDVQLQLAVVSIDDIGQLPAFGEFRVSDDASARPGRKHANDLDALGGFYGHSGRFFARG
jgi:hypothetical protein